MGEMILDYDITTLESAKYNPRQISESQSEKLRESINKLGIVKPLIVNKNLLVAGHQRTKALLSLGITIAPVYLLEGQLNIYDEIRFNQLHNGTDLDSGEENCNLNTELTLGFQTIEVKTLEANFRSKFAVLRREMCQLILKYGSWGAVVATVSGKVIHAAQYAMAAKLMNVKLTVFAVPDDRAEEYQYYLNSRYGVFDYDHLPKNTYIQSFAQPYRLRGDNSFKSILYEKYVIPRIEQNRSLRILDFGSGQGDYAKQLRGEGFDIVDLEFFRREAKRQVIDIKAVNRMIDILLNSISKNGMFDIVISDFVLNSVDSRKAEESVIALLNYFCKTDGLIFVSGRSIREVQYSLNSTVRANRRRGIEFLDDNGFSGFYRKGEWFYQKFHTNEQLIKLAFDTHLKVEVIKYGSLTWQMVLRKEQDLSLDQYLSALAFEFNLPLPMGKSVNRHLDFIKML